MAKNVITLTVTLNKEQAQRQIDEMKVSLKGMKDELSVVQNKLNDRDLWGPKDTFEGLKAREKALTKEIKLTEKAVTNGIREIEGYENKLAHLSELNYNTLTQMRTAYTNSLKNIKRETQEELEVYNEKAEKLQSIRDEIAKRDIDVRGGMTEQKAKEVVASPKNYSQSELQDAIKVMEKLRDMQVMGGKQWKEYATQVENANKVLDAFKDKVKLDAMTAQFKDLGNISEKALSDQKKYWQEMVAGAANGSKELEQYEKNLAKVVAEEQKRTKEQAGKVMNNLTDYSVTEIKEAIKATEQLRDAQKPGSKAWAEYAAQVKNASDYLDSFKNKAQLEAMNTQFKNLGKLSADALAEQKKYWQSMVNGAANGSKELEQYRKILAQVTEEERKRSAASVKNVMANPAKYSVNEIKEAIKVTEQLRDAQQPGGKQWKEYATQVENANKVLKNFNDSAKMEHMLGQLSNVGKLSKSALVEQKKFWQEMVDGAEKGSNELKKYEQSLNLIKKEERKRISEEGSKVTNKVISGNWSGTVGEAKEAIELLKQYKETLDTADTKGIERVENAIDQLNKKTEASTEKIVENRKKTKKATQEVTSEWEELMSYEKAFETAQSVQDGIFDGTEKEIKAAIRSLKEYKKNLRFESDKESIEDTVKALRVLERQAKTSSGSVRLIGQVLADLPHASMEELEWAAEELKKELHGATRHLGDYNTKAAQLRQVNLELERAKKEWKGQESAITRVVKRLTAYVAVYKSYNFISSKIKEAIKWNLELSDSIADIQKTTGLSAESVANLSNQINAIDTRTAQKELHDLAYEAGKLGISAEEDVLAFVRAGNQLLVALGEDLGGAEAVRQLMKVNAILGETQELGVEKALLATGSAINEISQTTRASAGPIADMVKRIGAIGAAANLGMADLVALAGTADAAGQSAEVSATAFNKFIATLSSNPVDVAYALGLDPSRIKSLMESGNTIQAIIEIFEKMNLKGDMADLSPLMKDLGSEGARMTQVLTTMAGQVDELKAQVFTSNKAFEEATSVTNEYNIKNESAAAIAQRFGNSIREYFVNSGFVDWLKEVLQWMYYLPNVLERNRVLLFGLRLIIGEIIALSIGIWLNNVAKSLNRLTVSLGFSSEAWTKTYMQVAKHTLAIQAEAGAEAMATKKALLHASALKKLQIAFVTLGKVMLKNPIFIIGTVVAATYATIRIFTDDTNKAAKAVAEFNATVSKEQFELANLRTQIKLANQANGERAALIQKLNSKYGQYLGFLVTEENYIRNQEYIYKLLNKQIERSVALKMQEKLSSDIASKYADKQKSSYEDLLVILNSTKGIGETGSKSAMSLLMESIKEQAVNGTEDITTILHGLLQKTSETYQKNLESLNERVEKGELEVGSKGYKALLNAFQNADLGASYHDLRSAIKTILDTETAIASEAATAAELSAHNIRSIEKAITSIKRDEAVRVLDLVDTTTGTKELQEYESKLKNATSGRLADIQGIIDKQRESNKLTEEEQTLFESVNQKIRNGAQLTDEESSKYNNLLNLKEETLGLTKEEVLALQTVNYEVLKYSKGLDTVQGKLAAAGKLNLWGDGKTIKDADVNQLVSMYERLESDAAKLAKGATSSIQTQYWKGFKDQKKAIAYYRSEAKKIKEELDERGFNTSGHFKWGSDRENSPEQIYRGWLAALEAYYNERETIIRQRGMEQNKLESEIARELEDLNAEKLASQRELEEGLLDDLYKGSTFDPKKFKGVITGTDYFANLTLESMRAIVSAGGPKLDAVIRKNLTDRMVKLEEQAYKIKQRIEKILLEDDFSEQVAQQYLNSLDQLGLLFNIKTEAMSDHSEEEGERRLAYMREWSKESYSLTAKDLQDKMEANAIFGDWVKKRTSEDYEALLIQLRKFHDDQEEAERKAAERRKKIFDNKWKYKIPDSESQENQTSIDVTDSARNIGLKMNDKVIEDLQERIKIEGNTIKAIHKRMDAEITAAKVSMHTAEIDKKNAEQTGLNVKERTEDYNKAKEQYESLISSRERYLRESSERIATHEQAIQDRIWEIRNANSGESREMINLLQAEIEKEQERVKLIHNRMDAEITAAKISMQTAEIDKKNAEQTGFNIKERTEEYIKAKAAYEELVAKLNSLIAEPTRKMEEYSQILAGKSSKETWNSLEESNANIRKEEADLKAYERFNELGLVSDYSVDEAQIELYRAKIKASQDYIEQIKKEMEQEILLAKFRMEDAQAVLAEIQEKGLADGEAKAAALQAEQEYQSLIRQQRQMTLDSENNIAEQRQLIAEKEMEIEKRKMDTMQQYVDTLSDFAQQMGEAAWGSVEDRQEAGKALLANVLKISKDLLQTYLIEVSTRKMMNDVEIANERYKQAQLQMIRVQSLASTGATMIGEMEAGAALSAAQIELNAAEAASKEAAKKGWIGLAIGAAISVALSALLGAALGRINKAKGEVAAATGASSGRLATGMLTYKEGNYPVLGNDGQVYNAKYEGAGMKTGIYGGGAHFGIFSEKKPEAIIDGDTTQRLILNHPDIWQSIVTLSKTGRLDRGMRTFASGNINELARTAQEADATATAQNNEQMLQMQATMAATQAAVMQLTQVLNQGIHAKIDMYGDGGMYKSMKKAESFASKRGYR